MGPEEIRYHLSTIVPPIKGRVTPPLAFGTGSAAFDLSTAGALGTAAWSQGGMVTLISDTDMTIGFAPTDDHVANPLLTGGTAGLGNTGWPIKKNVAYDYCIATAFPWLHGVTATGTASVQVYKSSARGDSDIPNPAGS